MARGKTGGEEEARSQCAAGREREEEDRDASCCRRSETFEQDRCGASAFEQERHADTPTS